jgi:hypothetical protein
MRIRKRLSRLKLGAKMETLNKNIRARPLKYVLSLIVFITLSYPLNSYAEETVDSLDKLVDKADKNTCSSSRVSKFRHLVISLIGLKKCLDPRATRIQKALYCSRPCCLVTGLAASYLSEHSTFGSPIHKIATVCCASSWSAYTFLLFFDSEKIEIKADK